MFDKKYKQLNQEFELLSMQFEDYKKKVKRESSELPMVVDFEQMKVVSIERIIKDDGTPVTILGYISPICSKLQEWILFCSDANHIILVEQFKKYINGGK